MDHAACSTVMTLHREAAAAPLAGSLLQGLLILRRDGSVERAASALTPTIERLATFALASFELLERLGEAGDLGAPRRMTTSTPEGQVVLENLGQGRLLFALAPHEAPLEHLIEDLDGCPWRSKDEA